MELGRVIRKYSLRTDVGERIKEKTGKYFKNYTSVPAGCYSACTLAYAGGTFRFLKSGSHLGVHRFAFTTPPPQEGAVDIAQIASASIVSYLREMDVDPDFFTLSTKAGSSEIYEPSRPLLEKLNVVNNGWLQPKWSIESTSGFIYLKGERDSWFGINKFIMLCPEKSTMVLHIIFDPQGRQDEVMGLPAHSLVIDGQPQPISPIKKSIENGWFNGEYALTPQQVTSIRRATSVGVILQAVYGAPVFLGFDKMPLKDGSNKLGGLLNSCGF